MLSIRNNISSLQAQKNMFSTQISLDTSIAKLSSGYRISKAQDDAAGSAIATQLGSEVASYAQATRNAQNGLNLVNVAEGAMGEIASMISRMREIAMESASDGVSDTERGSMQLEVDNLNSEIDRLATVTEFNGFAVFGGNSTFQVGIRNTANDQFSITGQSVDSGALGSDVVDVSTLGNAQGALDDIDAALDLISQARADNGATGARLEHIIASLQTSTVAATDAFSSMKDVDVAEESSKLTRSQIMMQAGVSVLAQANQLPMATLKLLG